LGSSQFPQQVDRSEEKGERASRVLFPASRRKHSFIHLPFNRWKEVFFEVIAGTAMTAGQTRALPENRDPLAALHAEQLG
jgi:hypothetical protein